MNENTYVPIYTWIRQNVSIFSAVPADDNISTNKIKTESYVEKVCLHYSIRKPNLLNFVTLTVPYLLSVVKSAVGNKIEQSN